MNKRIFVALFFVLWSCSKSKLDVPEFEVKQVRNITTDGFSPNSYLISSSIRLSNGEYIYYDGSVSRLIFLNKDFKLLRALNLDIGEGPGQLSIYVNHYVNDEFIFVLGAYEVLIYNRASQQLLQQLSLDMDPEWIHEFLGELYLGAHDYDQMDYGIYKIVHDNSLQFRLGNKVAVINFPENLDESNKSTVPVAVKGHFFVLKKEVGYLVKFNQSFDSLFDSKLPFSIPEKENFFRQENGQFDLNYYEAWDIACLQDQIYVLRHFDLIKTRFSDSQDRQFRKSLQVYNLQGEITGKINLPEHARYISFIDGQLMTVDEYDEQYILYEVGH